MFHAEYIASGPLLSLCGLEQSAVLSNIDEWIRLGDVIIQILNFPSREDLDDIQRCVSSQQMTYLASDMSSLGLTLCCGMQEQNASVPILSASLLLVLPTNGAAQVKAEQRAAIGDWHAGSPGGYPACTFLNKACALTTSVCAGVDPGMT